MKECRYAGMEFVHNVCPFYHNSKEWNGSGKERLCTVYFSLVNVNLIFYSSEASGMSRLKHEWDI